MRKVLGCLAAGMMVAAGAMSLAQETRDPVRRPAADRAAGTEREPAAGARTARPGQSSPADQQIAACKLGGCHNELELAKLAKEKATSPEVKAFAERMIREHTPACEKLAQVAGPLAADHGHDAAAEPGRPATRPARPGLEGAVPDAPREGAAPRDGAAPREPREAGAPREAAPPRAGAAADEQIEVRVQPGRPGARPAADVNIRAGGADGGLDWVSIHNEVAQQCLASAKKELGSKEGAEFDKCYMGMAVASHQKAIDMDQVFMKHASQQFKSDIQEGMKMASAHLEQAKSICKKLEGSSERVTRRPE